MANKGVRWTQDEDVRLRELLADPAKSDTAIAAVFDRTAGAVASRRKLFACRAVGNGMALVDAP
jgi:hypothetical protein